MAEESSNRILLPAASYERALRLLPLAIPIARAWQAEVVLLHVVYSPTESETEPSAREDWLRAIANDLQAAGIQATTMVRSGHSISGVIREIADEIHPRLLLLSWRSDSGSRVQVSDLMLNVPCDLLAWHGPTMERRAVHVLLPSGGGPNAALAMQIANAFIEEYGGELTVLSVMPSDGDADDFAGTQAAMQTQVETLLTKGPEQVHVRITRARNPTDGILAAAESREFDLLMIGATREHALSRLVFGVAPQKVAERTGIPVLVVKRPPPRHVSLMQRGWMWFHAKTPTLNEQQKYNAYIEVRRSARADHDFLTMMALSTLIASFGLLLNSAAVVIGAMLVAPLMGAIVGMGLGVVEGDLKLLRLAAGTTVRGVVLAITLAFVAGLLTFLIMPGIGMTQEMLARGQPNLLDLFVAIFAGAAGAYALCRENVKASLSGVAIAVALVPPLATVGLSLALGDFRNAGGAALLFLTNLIAIAATGGFVFLLLGFEPEPSHPERMQIFARGWRGLGVLIGIILLVLIWVSFESGKTSCEQQFRGKTASVACAEISNLDGATLVAFTGTEGRSGVYEIRMVLAATTPITQDDLRVVQAHLAETFQQPVILEVEIIPTFHLGPTTAESPG